MKNTLTMEQIEKELTLAQRLQVFEWAGKLLKPFEAALKSDAIVACAICGETWSANDWDHSGHLRPLYTLGARKISVAWICNDHNVNPYDGVELQGNDYGPNTVMGELHIHGTPEQVIYTMKSFENRLRQIWERTKYLAA